MRCSDSSPSQRALAPVATITACARYSSRPTQTRNGRSEKSTFVTSSVIELGAEALGLAAEVGHHLGPDDAVGVAGVVLDVARDHQLAAPLEALDHERLQLGARCVERSGVPGGAAADDDQLTHVVGVAQRSSLKMVLLY